MGKLGIVVVGTFIACWWPFLQNKETALSVLNRLFPIGRGLYEDKVANFWCSLSPVCSITGFNNFAEIFKLFYYSLGTEAETIDDTRTNHSNVCNNYTVSCIAISFAFIVFTFSESFQVILCKFCILLAITQIIV